MNKIITIPINLFLCIINLIHLHTSKALKIKMYMTLPRPIVLYGSETWALRKTEESRLMNNDIREKSSTENFRPHIR